MCVWVRVRVHVHLGVRACAFVCTCVCMGSDGTEGSLGQWAKVILATQVLTPVVTWHRGAGGLIPPSWGSKQHPGQGPRSSLCVGWGSPQEP